MQRPDPVREDYVGQVHPKPAIGPRDKALRALSSALLDVTRAAEKTVPPVSDPKSAWTSSLMAKLFTTASETNLERFVADGAIHAERSLLSACDHTRAFALLLRNDRPSTTALGTLARGSLEALAKCWWLTRDIPADEYLHRLLSLRYSELRHAQHDPRRSFLQRTEATLVLWHFENPTSKQ